MRRASPATPPRRSSARVRCGLSVARPSAPRRGRPAPRAPRRSGRPAPAPRAHAAPRSAASQVDDRGDVERARRAGAGRLPGAPRPAGPITSISSTATAAARSIASPSRPGEAASVNTVRLWSGSLWASSSRRPPAAPSAVWHPARAETLESPLERFDDRGIAALGEVGDAQEGQLGHRPSEAIPLDRFRATARSRRGPRPSGVAKLRPRPE